MKQQTISIEPLDSDAVHALEFSRSSRYLALVQRGYAAVIDLATGEMRGSCKVPGDTSHAVSILDSGEGLITGERALAVYPLPKGKRLPLDKKFKRPVVAQALDASEERLASISSMNSGDRARVHHLGTKEVVADFRDKNWGKLDAVAFVSDDEIGILEADYVYEVWSISKKALVRSQALSIETAETSRESVLSPDGSLALSQMNGEAILWSTATGEVLWRKPSRGVGHMDAAGNRIITYEDGLMLHERSTDRVVCLELSGTTRAISPCGRFLAATPQGDQREVVLIDFDDHLPLPADWLEDAAKATPASAVEKKTTKSAAKKSAKGAAKKQKTPWLKAHRTKLTAIVHSQPCDPDGFYLSAESAWERLAPGKPLPDSLDRAEERERQEYFGLRAPKDLRKVNLATDFWNALVALWSQVEGVGFILDLALEHLKPEAPEISFKYLSFEGQPFYWALRRYLHIATPEQFAEAADRIRAIVESTDAVARVHEGPRRELRDGLAFAFSRDTDWPSRVLQRNADEGGYSSLAGLFALVSVSPDFDLAMAALRNAYPGGTIYTGAFDVIENFGAQAFEILDTPQVRNSYVNKSELESATKLAKKLIGS